MIDNVNIFAFHFPPLKPKAVLIHYPVTFMFLTLFYYQGVDDINAAFVLGQVVRCRVLGVGKAHAPGAPPKLSLALDIPGSLPTPLVKKKKHFIFCSFIYVHKFTNGRCLIISSFF